MHHHFAEEEFLMRMHDYPGLPDHIKEHRSFTNKLFQLRKTYLDRDISSDLIVLLKEWLMQHVSKTDMQYVPYLTADRRLDWPILLSALVTAWMSIYCRPPPPKRLPVSERTVVSALTSQTLLSVPPSASVYRAAVLMAEVACGSALVLSAGAVIGIITERDILSKIVVKSIDPAEASVESVMTKDPVCARPEMSVPHALFIMKELGFRHLPIVDDDHIPLGIFALRDALPDEWQEPPCSSAAQSNSATCAETAPASKRAATDQSRKLPYCSG